MSSAETNEPIDILKKSAMVAVLVGALLLLHRFAVPGEGFDPRGLLALGFVVLATYAIGELAEVIGLPHITGYLLAGVVLGPSAAHLVHDALPWLHLPPPLDHGVLSEDIIKQLNVLNDLALALIALTAGGELKLDALRQGAKQIFGILVGQGIPVVLGTVACLWAITEVMPESVRAISSLPLPAVLALGGVVASLAFATSPAATIAVINGTKSSGPMAQTVLSTVVLKDVIVVTAFSAATALAMGVLGVEGGGSFVDSLGHIALSLAVGLLLGGGIHLYLRFIGAELLLFLVAMIYTATFLVEELHGEPALMFIVAGIVVGNFSDLGETLIHEVERLSLPVYVVFFTMAGAKLHLDHVYTMLLPAIALVGVRVATLYVGVRAGASLTGAPPTVVRYGWMGFVSQAGVVIALANQTPDAFPGEVGQTLFSLLLAGVAINEVIGPVLLQWGLGYAGEVRGGPGADGADPHGEPTPVPAAPTSSTEDHWGAPLPTGHPQLDQTIEELAQDLSVLGRELTWQPLQDHRQGSEAWLRQLRRAWVRIARRATVRPGPPAEQAAALRNDVGELGERWRDLVLDLAARSTRADRFTPLTLVTAIDAHITSLPERFEAPTHPDVLAPRAEGRWSSARRTLTRARQRFVPTRREVPLRQLARFHFSGQLPARLEGVAALLINAELNLATRVNVLFTLAAEGLEGAAVLAETKDPEAVARALTALREELDQEFDIALGELETIVEDGVARVSHAMGGAMQQLRNDVRTIGTLDLAPRHRRYSHVFSARNEAISLLGPGLQAARTVVAGRLSQLALELELTGFQGRVRTVVHEQADHLARNLRGRGATQLTRIASALGGWLAQAREVLDESPSASTLAAQLRETSEPIVFQISEAEGVTQQLVTQLADEGWVNELIDVLRIRAQDLTDRYTVPSERPVIGDWTLPTPTPTSEVPFRDLVAGFIEVRVTRELLDLSVELSEQSRTLVSTLTEVERVLAFNVELAGTELDLLDPEAPIPTASRDLVHAMVVGAVGRSHGRLAPLAEAANTAAVAAQERVETAVLEGIAGLRGQILDGRLSELRSFWLREGPLGRQIRQRARRWRGLVPSTQARVGRLVRRALGEDQVLALRARLGLPEVGDERDLRSALMQPTPAMQVPLVYRRLFSENALEAGDLLSGRQEELERIRAALATDGEARPSNRAVAVVGLDPQANLALVTAATRSAQTLYWTPTEPVGEAQVDDWFDALPTGRTVVLQDLRWFFVRRPSGFAPLQRLVHRLVDLGGRNGFVIVADRSVWQYCRQISGLEEAMGTVIHLAALDVEKLEQALLSRHAMSGYGLAFHADDDLGWQLQHVLLRGEDRELRRQRAWFGTLHDASAGVLQDALRLWMAAITQVDADGQVHVGAVPRPPLTRLADLPEEDLLTLLEITRQGWIDVALHQQLFRTEGGWSKAHLAQLRHVGLLVPDNDVLKIAPHLRGPLHRVLVWRGWV